VLFEVADTGPGIEEGLRDRLFRDFERLGQTTVEGAGLGLAITARMAVLMGGRIGYRPNPVGGSIFWLELPTGEPALSAPALTEAAPAQESGRHVLLVDDTAMNRDVLAAFLRVAGHQTEEAESGEQAIRLARERRFDLILMDIRMPHMDGLETTRHIRSLPDPHGRVPILAVTASAVRDMEAQCRDAGMDGFLSKPVDYATLIRAVA
jgi:CheY-like chemotaxis protein